MSESRCRGVSLDIHVNVVGRDKRNRGVSVFAFVGKTG
jgi:hypothetical protein